MILDLLFLAVACIFIHYSSDGGINAMQPNNSDCIYLQYARGHWIPATFFCSGLSPLTPSLQQPLVWLLTLNVCQLE